MRHAAACAGIAAAALVALAAWLTAASPAWEVRPMPVGGEPPGVVPVEVETIPDRAVPLALDLYAALATADAMGRASPEFALVGELGRFPSAEALDPLEALARDHLCWLYNRRELDRDIRPDIDDLWREQDRVVDAYRLLGFARSCWWSCEDRRETADQLRDLIGKDAYFFGRLPGPVP